MALDNPNSEISLTDLHSDRNLAGDITLVERVALGEGHESVVHKATLKVGEREVPVVIKIPKRERSDKDIPFADLDRIRRHLEKQGKLIMPYFYGQLKEGIVVQEFIPGNTLKSELEKNPHFFTDQYRQEFIEMALELGTAIEQETVGKFCLASLSPDDIIVNRGDDQTKVKREGKLTCLDPSIMKVSAYTEFLFSEKNVFMSLFRTDQTQGENSFKIIYKDPLYGETSSTIDSITACFVQKPDDLNQLRESKIDLDVLGRSEAQRKFEEFCQKNSIFNRKIITFLFELFYSEVTHRFHKTEEAQAPAFKFRSKFSELKNFYESIDSATSPTQSHPPQ